MERKNAKNFLSKKTHLSIRIIILLLIWILLISVLAACGEADTGSSKKLLGRLPSGMELITGNRMMYNTNVKSTVLPFGGLLIGRIYNNITTIIINIFDFFLFPIALIPGINKLIGFLYSCPDIDLHSIIFTNHRNFITHSVLNPFFFIFTAVSLGLNRLLKGKGKIKWILVLPIICILVFSAHLNADSMPMGWRGTAFVYVKLFGIGFRLGAFLSRMWLLINSWVSLGLCLKITSDALE